MKQPISIYTGILLLLVLIYFPIFGHLDTLVIRLWDESRLANNAYEMNKDGNWMVTHFDGKPDIWNTKPPLMIWSQVICMKLFGVNELSVRLPSAIAAFLTCVLLFILAMYYLKNFWFGFISVVVLVTMQGYISEHGTRTGDYDALVTFFCFLTCMSFFGYTEKPKAKYLYLFFAGLTLGVLTKGITVLIFLPALFLYSVFTRKLPVILKNRHFYAGIVIFLFFTVGYYALREHMNPGYLKAVGANELGGRYFSVLEGNSGDFWYFYKNMTDKRLVGWTLLVPCGLLIGLFLKDNRTNRLTLFSLFMSLVFFLVISVSKTKLEWYDIPLYPFLAILIANFVHFVFDRLGKINLSKIELKYNILPYLFLFLICIGPYGKIIDKTFKPVEPAMGMYETTYFLKAAWKGKTDLSGDYFLDNGYNGSHLFYIRLLQYKGVNIGYKDWTKLNVDDKVIAYQSEINNYIQNNYLFDVLSRQGGVTIYRITAIKK